MAPSLSRFNTFRIKQSSPVTASDDLRRVGRERDVAGVSIA
jgi:hypothetical protein